MGKCKKLKEYIPHLLNFIEFLQLHTNHKLKNVNSAMLFAIVNVLKWTIA